MDVSIVAFSNILVVAAFVTLHLLKIDIGRELL